MVWLKCSWEFGNQLKINVYKKIFMISYNVRVNSIAKGCKFVLLNLNFIIKCHSNFFNWNLYACTRSMFLEVGGLLSYKYNWIDLICTLKLFKLLKTTLNEL
jgi:hypothetical protein